MRKFNHRHTAAVAAALGCAVASNAYAEKGQSQNPCDLLTWQDIQSFGVGKDTPITEAGWHQEETPKGLPGSKLLTNMCAVVTNSDAGRSSITLSFDSFKGKATETQIAGWIKTTTPAVDEEDEKPTIVTLGTTTCESGKYNLPTAQDDDTLADVDEHYVACDTLAGTHHVSLNIHVPAGKKSSLYTPEQAKALLDKAVARMKEKSFAAPDIAADKTARKT